MNLRTIEKEKNELLISSVFYKAYHDLFISFGQGNIGLIYKFTNVFIIGWFKNFNFFNDEIYLNKSWFFRHLNYIDYKFLSK